MLFFYRHRRLPQGICGDFALSYDRHFAAMRKAVDVQFIDHPLQFLYAGFCTSTYRLSNFSP